MLNYDYELQDEKKEKKKKSVKKHAFHAMEAWASFKSVTRVPEYRCFMNCIGAPDLEEFSSSFSDAMWEAFREKYLWKERDMYSIVEIV